MLDGNLRANSDTSTDVVLDGPFGSNQKITLDRADLKPEAYAADWLSIIALPARPSVFFLDAGTGIICGSISMAMLMLVAGLFGQAYALGVAFVKLFSMYCVISWAKTNKSPYIRYAIPYRLSMFAIGYLIVLI